MRRERNSDPFHQKKSLGQVFLKADWPVQRMAQRLQDLGVTRVIEVGPGPGILTRALAGAGIKVTAVEKDTRFAERLAEQIRQGQDSALAGTEVINEDILEFDIDGWLAGGSGNAAVAGNIPYNISSPLLIKALGSITRLKAIMFMTQLEFAARVSASPSTKDYGSLSVFAQLRADIHFEFKVERTCFHPVPKVDSAVVTLLPRRNRLPDRDLMHAEQVTRIAFMQRRKKLRNSVRQFTQDKPDLQLPIDLDRRADSLSPAEFLDMARAIFGE